MEEIYLDYAATTPVDEAALDAAAPYFSDVFYNPSSAHVGGQRAAKAVEEARARCAAAIGADPSEIIFTSGGTESVNLALLGIKNLKRIVASAIEHDSVLGCTERLKDMGAEVATVIPNKDGIITPEALKTVMTEQTSLVCVMTVNNQTGAVQPVKELAKVAHDYGAMFFTDAVQAVSSVQINVKDSGVDMLAASGHKFHAPKGVGFLYVKNGVGLAPLAVGGGQERGARAGTQNVPSIVAMGKAIETAVKSRAENIKKNYRGGSRVFERTRVRQACFRIAEGGGAFVRGFRRNKGRAARSRAFHGGSILLGGFRVCGGFGRRAAYACRNGRKKRRLRRALFVWEAYD